MVGALVLARGAVGVESWEAGVLALNSTSLGLGNEKTGVPRGLYGRLLSEAHPDTALASLRASSDADCSSQTGIACMTGACIAIWV